jgi:hypothetical protein
MYASFFIMGLTEIIVNSAILFYPMMSFAYNIKYLEAAYVQKVNVSRHKLAINLNRLIKKA